MNENINEESARNRNTYDDRSDSTAQLKKVRETQPGVANHMIVIAPDLRASENYERGPGLAQVVN